MIKLLINCPLGQQQVVEIDKTGEYFDQSRVVWDERYNGDLPDNITLGKMVFDDGTLKTLDDYLPDHAAWVAAQQIITEKKVKNDQLDADTKTDVDLALLREMSVAEIDEWFNENVKTVIDSSKLLKKIVKSLVKQNLL